MNSRKTAINMGKVTIYLLLFVFAIISLLPLYWVFSTAFQLGTYQDEEMSIPISYVESNPPKLYPMGIPEYFEHWRKALSAEKAGDVEQEAYHRETMRNIVDKTLEGFSYLFKSTNIWRWILNSFYIAVVVTAGILLIDSMAGYVLAKKNFPGRNLIFWIIVSTMMIPGQGRVDYRQRRQHQSPRQYHKSRSSSIPVQDI